MILVVLRIFFGLVFILSAVLKLNPIEFFELVILDTITASKPVAVYLARLFIGLEFLLGTWLIFGLKQRLALWFSALLLVGFTLQNIYIWLNQGQNSNCGCFGIYLQFGPLESVIKNIGLLLINVWLIVKYKIESEKIKKWKKVILLCSPLLLGLPFVLFPPNWYLGSPPDQLTSNIFPVQLNELPNQNFKKNYYEGEHLLLFFSTSCIHCIKAAYEVSIAGKKFNLPETTSFFVGDQSLIPIFFEKSNAKFDSEIYENSSFIKVTEGKFPVAFYINDGKLLQKYSGDAITIQNLQTTFQNR